MAMLDRKKLGAAFGKIKAAIAKATGKEGQQ